MTLARATSFVTTRIVIEVLYFGIITPVGLLRRLVADNPTTPARNEQRLNARARGRPSNMERQFSGSFR